MHHRREYAGREYSPRFFYKEVRDRHCGKRQCAAAQRKQQSRDIARYKRRQKYPCNKYQCGIICFPPEPPRYSEKRTGKYARPILKPGIGTTGGIIPSTIYSVRDITARSAEKTVFLTVIAVFSPSCFNTDNKLVRHTYYRLDSVRYRRCLYAYLSGQSASETLIAPPLTFITL